jgi:hypothetical protein
MCIVLPYQHWRPTAIFIIVMVIRLLVLCGCAILARATDNPIWGKAPTLLGPTRTRGHATAQRIVSPDGKTVLQVFPAQSSERFLRIRISREQGQRQDVDLDEGAHELLWAPDSTAFFVNGSTSVYAGFFTAAYRFGPDGLRKLNLTGNAQRDMLTSFPPCKASNRIEAFCMKIERNPEFNISGLAWIGPSQIVVMAEIPCVSAFGGIMCQIQGYVLGLPDGRIIERLPARELKTSWQRTWRGRCDYQIRLLTDRRSRTDTLSLSY